jgi:hypothetical protein
MTRYGFKSALRQMHLDPVKLYGAEYHKPTQAAYLSPTNLSDKTLTCITTKGAQAY